jgi:glucuronate isomerase
VNSTNIVTMINRFIAVELERVYKQFNRISDEEKIMVASFIDKIEKISASSDVGFDPYKEYELTKAMAELLEDEEDMDVVTFYLFLKLKLAIDAELSEVKRAKEDLEQSGYIKFRGYHFYHREEQMIVIAEDEVLTRLDDSFEVVEMFDHDTLAEMWVSCTSKSEAARNYLSENNNWWEIIDCSEPEEGYTDSEGNIIMCCYDGNGS